MKLNFFFAAVAFVVGASSVLASPMMEDTKDQSMDKRNVIETNDGLLESREVNDNDQTQQIYLVKRGKHRGGRRSHRGRKGGMMAGPPPAAAMGGGMGGPGGMPDMSAGQ